MGSSNTGQKPKIRPWHLMILGIVASLGVAVLMIYLKNPASQPTIPETAPQAAQAPSAPTQDTQAVTPPNQTMEKSAVSNQNPDLTADTSGLSKATVVMKTNKGTIKYKFYPKDAPQTVGRMVELINQGFYNGLTFHRVVPGFVIQGGDPQGNGTGGSGKKLPAEFNSRHHVEGTVAMARAADPGSADSQFYISLGTHPHLDNQYTVFGQVVEGMDVAKKISPGDKMETVTVQ